MNKYIVNTESQITGEYEVHDLDENCDRIPDEKNRQDLGYHLNCESAVNKAKEYYDNVDGCFYCAKECHTR